MMGLDGWGVVRVKAMHMQNCIVYTCVEKV